MVRSNDAYHSLSAPLTSAAPSIPSSSSSSYVQLPDPVLLSGDAPTDSTAPSSSAVLAKLRPYKRWIIGASVIALLLLLIPAVMAMVRLADRHTANGGGGGGGSGGGGSNGGGGGDGGGGAAIANASCAQTKIETEGPYWVDEKLNRSDLAATAVGLNLALELLVYNSSISERCVPIVGAMVDIWHADALGLYSDEQILGTKGKTFLRGYQLTNADGIASFLTIWPGWYSGRTVHVHVRVRVFDASGKVVHNQTTQLFYDDAINDAVMATVPYSNKSGRRDTRNANDNLFNKALLMNVTGDVKSGYSGSFAFGVPFMR